MHTCVHVCVSSVPMWRSEDNLVESVLSIHHVVPEGTQQKLDLVMPGFRSERPRAEAKPQSTTVLWFQIAEQNSRKAKTICHSGQKG